MKLRKRILAGFMASLFMVSSLPVYVSAGNTGTASDTSLSEISVSDGTDMETLLSGAYMEAYEVKPTSYECVGGGTGYNAVDSAFDNDWDSYWKATDKSSASSITVTFAEATEISRILYGVWFRLSNPEGYPEELTIEVSATDTGEDFVPVAAGRSEARMNKVIFALEKPVSAKRLRLVFDKVYNVDFAAAAELKFIKSDPVFEKAENLFENDVTRQLREEYQSDEALDALKAEAESHVAKNYLLPKILLAKKIVTGEVLAEDPLDFPVEIIQKTGPDSENLVFLYMPDRYVLDQMDEYMQRIINDEIKRVLREYHPYVDFANDINIYALRIPSNESDQTGDYYFLDWYADSYFDSIARSGNVDITSAGWAKAAALVRQVEQSYLDKGGKVTAANIDINTSVLGGVTWQDTPAVSLQSRGYGWRGSMVHEMSHAAGKLQDEYRNGARPGPNVVEESDPAKAPWKEFLGFRNVSHVYIEGSMYRPSNRCLMESTSYFLCEYCKLAMTERFNGQVANKRELYIAKPIAEIDYYEETDDYITGGTEITANNIEIAKGQPIQYRTVVKNFTKTPRNLTLEMYIVGADGNKKYEKSESYTVNGNEIKSLRAVIENPADLVMGDRVTGRLIDTDTKEVLMDGDTYLNTEKYATLTIKYMLGDEKTKTATPLPNVAERQLKLEANSTYELKQVDLEGYEYTGYECKGKTVEGSSIRVGESEAVEIIYYYTKDRGKVTLELTDDGKVSTKERYINRGETFTPSQSDFPAKDGYRLVLPEASEPFDGINEDQVLRYTYGVGEPDPEPEPIPSEPKAPEIPEENIVTEEVYQYGAINLTDNIIKLPRGATVKVIGDVSSDVVGSFTFKVRVTFANGTYRDVDIPVIVREEGSEEEPGAHTHSYSEDWSHDETNHWRECSCGDVTDHEPHTAGGEAAGDAAQTCTKCGYAMQEVPGHVHSYNSTWKSDSDSHWHECTDTGCPDRDGSRKDTASHIPGPEATEDTAQTCTECGYVIQAALGHSHNYSSDWSSDSTGHWHACPCGEKGSFAAHTPGPEATEDTAQTCTECGYVIQAALGHTHEYSSAWSADVSGHWHECSCGSKADSAAHTPGPEATEGTAQTCTVCSYVIQPALGHTHNYSSAWSSDSTGHWHACPCGEKGSFAAHIPGPAATQDTAQTCTECGYVIQAALGHTHEYSSTWSADISGHWHECPCGSKADSAAHIPGPAATQDKAQTCTECGYVLQPALSHTHSGGQATCAAPAACSGCGQGYGSKDPGNHTGGTETRDQAPATDTQDGYTGDTYCKGCGAKLATGTAIPATGGGTGGDENLLGFPFTDVPQVVNEWKYESVKYVYHNGIMNGISGTTLFQPDHPLTRAMFATVLYRMAGSPAISYTAQFPDVPDGEWYSKAVLWAYQQDIVEGFSDGSYGINVNITREQIAKMLFEYAKKSGYDTGMSTGLEGFTDSDEVSHWATGYMQWAVAVEMISGKPNEDRTYRLDPKGEATRAECAAMLTRFQNKYKAKPDTP